MRIRIDEIDDSGLIITLTGEENILRDSVAASPLPLSIGIDPKVRGLIRILPNEEGLLLRGNVEAVLMLQCSRCLADFTRNSAIALDLIVRRRATEDETEDQEFAEEESETFYIDGDTIDPGDVILQELLLDVPMKPLCKEDCPGLCPTCGAPKGSPECRCPVQEQLDSRWAALQKLKEKIDS